MTPPINKYGAYAEKLQSPIVMENDKILTKIHPMLSDMGTHPENLPEGLFSFSMK